MTLETISAVTIKAYCDIPHLFQTNRLWKDIDPSQFSIKGYDGKILLCLSTDLNANNFKFSHSSYKIENDIVSMPVLNKNVSFQSAAHAAVPLIIDDGVHFSRDDLIEKLKPELIKLAIEFDVEIIVTEKSVYERDETEITNAIIYINIVGLISRVQNCELHTTILVQLVQNKIANTPLFIESLDIESSSLIPFCIGVDMTNIKHLASVYKTDIHIPTLLNDDDMSLFAPQVFFSSRIHSLASEAKHEMSQYIEKLKENIYYRSLTSLSPGKLLYIKTYYQEEIFKLMIKYNTYIKITDDSVKFQSSSNEFLAIVIKLFTTSILHEIVEVQMILDGPFEFTDDNILNELHYSDKSHIVFMRNTSNLSQLVVIGSNSHNVKSTKLNEKHQLLQFLTTVFENEKVNSNLVQLRAIFEIHPDYEEFISGKKNGKLTRIMEGAECLLELKMTENDDNINLFLLTNTYKEFLRSYIQVMDELPAEKSFFIPEVYHRPVIGAGGSLIQTTMRKHNVFIQFSNSFLLPRSEFSHLRYDNVIIRCPTKSESNIIHAKQELNVLAQNYGSTQSKSLVNLSAGQYRYILKTSPEVIGQIEKSKNVYILFPFEQPGSEFLLEIRGTFENSEAAARELIDQAFGGEIIFDLETTIKDENDFYNSVIIPFNRVYNIIITLQKNHVTLTYNKNNSLLEKCIEELEKYFLNNKLKITKREQIKDFIHIPPMELQDMTLAEDLKGTQMYYHNYNKNQYTNRDSVPDEIQNTKSYIQYPYYRYGYGY
ncbi:hypothetical protein TPHA_0F00300 [Tetrapisispora phaffii CBS 4417]|uniref:K Homology domain-containing protein n=1 Tax=Tetrapisispora phaffii (strain ATCC 24235 / CBS 4417 / NBRC 1672 / NRRL Y-8282 / UCD 70-5) TaxID=1071381 RepID=G8BUT5_TETPH|nr:hypothetical protein TPHA_0F00300 [Tetrapisispora phaffii CBS 4417]CCE63517.1 hypothetical protein TPHA_0F00300 [Tetrapisispora phaffii CBS 4417]